METENEETGDVSYSNGHGGNVFIGDRATLLFCQGEISCGATDHENGRGGYNISSNAKEEAS